MTQITYQSNESSSGGTSHKNIQERFSATMLANTALSTKLRMNAILRFDIITRESDPGSKSTELDPDIMLRFSTKAAQLNLGYRRKLTDTSTISGATTTTRTSDTTEAVADTTIRAGRLPNIRLRYARRDMLDETDGITTSDSTTDDARGSINYKLGIFALNADYTIINTKNNVTGQTVDNSQFAGQVSADKRFSPKVNVMLRENYSFSDVNDSASGTTNRNQSISEARLVLTPITRMGVNANYLYRVQDENGANITEASWNASGNYALPRYLRFYGAYSTRRTENVANVTNLDSTVIGVNFRHAIGKFAFISRYERRTDMTTVEYKDGVTPTVETDNTRSNIDWLLSANMSRFIKLALSESYVITDATSGTSENNQFRLKASIGPIGKLTMDPYVDYTIATSNPAIGEASDTKTTQLVVPASYRLDFSGRMQLTLTDNYVLRSTEDNTGTKTSASSNNAVIRLAIPRLMKSVRFDADASFVTTSSNGLTTSSSAYSARLSWNRRPHSLNTDIRYQTNSTGTTSTSYGARYGLVLRMRKLLMMFSAQYSYGITHGNTGANSTTQMILLLLTLRN